MQALTVTPGKVHQTKYGALPHSDMIGKRFGTKVVYTHSQPDTVCFALWRLTSVRGQQMITDDYQHFIG